MKVWRQGEGPVFNYTKMTVNTLSRGWLDYARMARLFGQLNNSLWGPTGCTQGEPAKSKWKTKGGLFKRAVLTGEPAVKPLLRQDKRNCQSTSDGNYLFYIYTFLFDTKFPFLCLYYEGFKAFCWTVAQRGAVEDTGTGLTLVPNPPVIKIGVKTSSILTNSRAWAK